MKKSTAIVILFLSLSFSLYASPINVSNLATAGVGTSASPWTGWDTAVNWSEEQEYYFPSGIYVYQVSPNFLKTGIALIGEAGTVLKHTGSGNAVIFDNPGTIGTFEQHWTENVRMENFIIQGNISTTNGLLLRGVRNGIFKHISVRDVSNAGLWAEACVTNILDNFRVTHHEMPNDRFNVIPNYGIVFETRQSDGAYCTTWTATNTVIEGTRLIGIWLLGPTYGNTFISGTSEGNLGKGIVVGQSGRASSNNTFIGMDTEANIGSIDVELWGYNNILQNHTAAGLVHIMAGSGNQLIGGFFYDITIDSHLNILQGVYYKRTLKDNDNEKSTIYLANVSEMNGGNRYDSFVGINHIYSSPLSSTGGIVNTDCRKAHNFYFPAYQDFVLNNPTNGINGQAITWRIQQGVCCGGNHAISYGSKFRPASGKPFPVLSTGNEVFDYITATYNSTRDTWDIQ